MGNGEGGGMELCKVCADDEQGDLLGRRYGRRCLGPLGEEGVDDADPMLVEQEAVMPAIARDPGMPSKEEREAHNVTHLPFRPWCEFCVKGRGRDRYHRRVEGEAAAQELPKISLDYGFLTQRCGSGTEAEQVEETEEERAKGGKAG